MTIRFALLKLAGSYSLVNKKHAIIMQTKSRRRHSADTMKYVSIKIFALPKVTISSRACLPARSANFSKSYGATGRLSSQLLEKDSIMSR